MKNIVIPKIGMRIVKSSISVAICFIVAAIRGGHGIVFYSLLSALWCMQSYVSTTMKNAVQRIIGTVTGALYGLIFLAVKEHCHIPSFIALHLTESQHELFAYLSYGFLVAILIMFLLWTTVLIKKKHASYFSCVVFLSVAVAHIGDQNIYLFTWNRFLDTMLGIFIGVAVNCFSLPKHKHKDVLFVSGVDGTLLTVANNMNDYCKVELNRMLDEGMKFTLSTMRTPAGLMELMKDIRLNIPVIAMNGAVLYDVRKNHYEKAVFVNHEYVQPLLDFARQKNLFYFTNVLIDNSLVIFYEQCEDTTQQNLVRQLSRSPYRNYVKRAVPYDENVIYFMMFYKTPVIEQFYEDLCAAGWNKKVKILKYLSTDFPGYSYIKIYHLDVSKENMLEYLKSTLDISKTVTFGTIQGKYDYVVQEGDSNTVVHTLKKLYEPVFSFF